MSLYKLKYDERLSPRANKILDRVATAIYLVIFLGPILFVVIRNGF